jgi:hypothetical protein
MAEQNFGKIAERFFGSALVSILGETAKSVLPNCLMCSSKAVPLPCILCGSFTCFEHGYHSIGRKEAICRKCLLDMLGDAGGVDLDPFEVLGIREDSTVPEIERAFRIKSKKCHPDLYPDDKDKEAQFKQLQRAREFAKAKAQGEEEK